MPSRCGRCEAVYDSPFACICGFDDSQAARLVFFRWLFRIGKLVA